MVTLMAGATRGARYAHISQTRDIAITVLHLTSVVCISRISTMCNLGNSSLPQNIARICYVLWLITRTGSPPIDQVPGGRLWKHSLP